ncbi:MAG: hypothetical protein ACLUOI_08485 [Eisenbergiella sp.]
MWRGCQGVCGTAGNILVDLYRSNPDGLDLDGNGKVSYVLLRGEQPSGFTDPDRWSIQTLKDGGVPWKTDRRNCQLGQKPASALMGSGWRNFRGN